MTKQEAVQIIHDRFKQFSNHVRTEKEISEMNEISSQFGDAFIQDRFVEEARINIAKRTL